MVARSDVRFTADEIWETPDDGNRYEVIDGELYVTPPPIWEHQYALGQLYFRIAHHVYTHALGKVVQAPVGVVLDEGSGVQPDLVYVSRERLGIIAERGVEGAPDLVAEVLSPSTRARDRGIKMKRYATAGIPQYWIVDPRARALEAYQLGQQGYEQVGTYGAGGTFRPELFPECAVAGEADYIVSGDPGTESGTVPVGTEPCWSFRRAQMRRCAEARPARRC